MRKNKGERKRESARNTFYRETEKMRETQGERGRIYYFIVHTIKMQLLFYTTSCTAWA